MELVNDITVNEPRAFDLSVTNKGVSYKFNYVKIFLHIKNGSTRDGNGYLYFYPALYLAPDLILANKDSYATVIIKQQETGEYSFLYGNSQYPNLYATSGYMKNCGWTHEILPESYISHLSLGIKFAAGSKIQVWASWKK